MNHRTTRILLPLIAAALWFGPARAEPLRNPHGPGIAECSLCHGPEGWAYRDGGFEHAPSGFPHGGGHAALLCRDCHAEREFAMVASGCADCHVDAHDGRLGFRCRDCHSPAGWSTGNDYFALHAERGFPLMGLHAGLDCEACHRGENGVDFAATPTECFLCHRAEYAATSDPDHAAAGFSTDCDNCHSSVGGSWGGKDFNHSWFYPLLGAHASAQCSACHQDGFAGTTRVCLDCHADALAQADEPDHAAMGFTADCHACHDATAWRPSGFDHATTEFALLGAHGAAACTDCHGGGSTAADRACFACHESDLAQATDPDHVAGGFPNECQTCHGQAAWSPADFDHSLSDFPLLGAHQTAACASCHTSGYAGTPSECGICHADDYAATSDPPHAASGFGQQCDDCHGSSAWEPANWDHDSLFPIYSGRHRSEWNACADCHVNQADYSAFECIFCHEHRQSETDGEHDEEPNYVYASWACYDCHPRGEAD